MLSIFVVIFLQFFLNNEQKSNSLVSNNISNENLKIIYPDINLNQIKDFQDISNQGNIVPCLDREDKTLCISSVAFFSKESYFCGEIENYSDNLKCADAVLSSFYAEKESKCKLLGINDSGIACFLNIFYIYKDLSDCLTISDSKIKNACNDSIRYQVSINSKNIDTCNDIIDLDLKNYCIAEINNIRDDDGDGLSNEKELRFGTKILVSDSDGDGLFDRDEIYKYNSNPLSHDSDGDGFNDGDEVKAGYNPNGSGLLKQ